MVISRRQFAGEPLAGELRVLVAAEDVRTLPQRGWPTSERFMLGGALHLPNEGRCGTPSRFETGSVED